MYRTIEDFANAYAQEGQTTAKVLAALSNAALAQEKTPGDISAGELAWHIASAPSMVVNQFGCEIPDAPKPEQLTVDAIVAEYARVSAATIDAIKARYGDADMATEVTAFDWPMPLGGWLQGLVCHEIHHRGQLSVMMRQAGLTVPSIYGPNKEDTAKFMAEMAAAQK